jgi:hypothetical protein
MTEVQKLSALENSNPLLDLGVLKHALSYVGPGHHVFVPPVSTRWRGIYSSLTAQQQAVCDDYGGNSTILCTPQMTLFSSVFAAPSRVQLAHEIGVDCRTRAYKRAAGKHADITTLVAAHSLGMDYTAAVIAGAAQCNKLATVQYLHGQSCPWAAGLLEEAARRGHFDLLRWCYEHGCTWQHAADAPICAAQSGNVELMAWVLQQPDMILDEDVMLHAVLLGHTALCQYLRAQQCPWNASSTSVAASTGCVDLLRWLMDNGHYRGTDTCAAARLADKCSTTDRNAGLCWGVRQASCCQVVARARCRVAYSFQ